MKDQRKKRALVIRVTDVCDAVLALSEKDGKDITTFIAVPVEYVDANEILVGWKK